MGFVRRRYFDDIEVTRRLETLTPRHRMVFAAGCAERTLWRYLQWAESNAPSGATEMAAILNRLWDVVEERAAPTSLRLVRKRVSALIPGSEDERPELGADDAALALLYAIDCAIGDGDANEAIDAADRSYESWLKDETRSGNVTTMAVIDEQEKASPVLQRELAFQLTLLEHLEREPNPGRNNVQEVSGAS